MITLNQSTLTTAITVFFNSKNRVIISDLTQI